MILELKNINKTYKNKTVLNDISYEFHNGIYGLLGVNGAGKTTLMNIITDNITYDSGEIICDGKIIRKGNDYNGKVGYLPQRMEYYEQFTGFEFMNYMSILKGGERKDTEEIDELLESVNLFNVKGQKIKTYSGGMKQRLGIAQAFLRKPELLILDEPTVGLDYMERDRFKKMLTEFKDKAIIILSTHIVADLDEVADTIVKLQNGCLE